MDTDSLDSENELFFTSSSRDKVAVELISKNLREFAGLAFDKGFDIKLQSFDGTEISVILVQANDSHGYEVVLTVFNDLLETKRRALILEEHELAKNSSKAVENYSENELKELLVEEIGKMKDYVDKQVEKGASEIKFCVAGEFQNTRYDKEKEAKFLEEKSLQFFKESDCLRFEIISYCVNKNPEFFYQLPDSSVADNAVGVFLSYLETDRCQIPYNVLIPQVCHEGMAYRPTASEISYLKAEFKEKYGLENTIGTVHFIGIDFNEAENKQTAQVLGVIIVNKKVVFSIKSHSRCGVCDVFIRNPLLYWAKDVRFAVCVPFNASPPLLKVPSEIETENSKVMTWMKNCFKMSNVHKNRAGLENLPYAYNFLLDVYCH